MKRTIIFLSCISFLFFSSCNIYYGLFYADPDKCFEIANKKKPFDVIIVPGFPYDDTETNNGVLKERVSWAAYLYNNGYTKNIIFSGGAVHTPYIEAEIMRLYALQFGIPNNHIFKETKAEHTTENLYYSYILAKANGFETIAFATEPAQASFMKVFKRKWKLSLEMLPVVTNCLTQISNPLKSIDASSAMVTNFQSLEQREGIFKRLRGTRGHKVKLERRKARKEKIKKK